MDELIDNYLPLYQIRYSYTEDKGISRSDGVSKSMLVNSVNRKIEKK